MQVRIYLSKSARELTIIINQSQAVPDPRLQDVNLKKTCAQFSSGNLWT